MTKFVLGLESTAHTFGASVVSFSPEKQKQNPPNPSNVKILSNAFAKYPSTKEGFIPYKMANFHDENFSKIVSEAIGKAEILPEQLDAVAYSCGPGIWPCLHVGHVAAKSLSNLLEIPLVPVNHALAHIEIARFLCGFENPLAVYVSGGNTQILALEKEGRGKKEGNGKNGGTEKKEGNEKRYRVLGETLDIGIGNFLDSVGRTLELKPPDAVGVINEIEKGKASFLPENNGSRKNTNALLQLPYSVKGMNMAFSGLLTAIEKLKGKEGKAAISFSAQEYSFSMLLEAVERALLLSGRKELILCGGNARNGRLKEMCKLMCKEQEAEFFVPPFEYCGDNAAMIALTGILQWNSKSFQKDASPKQRIRVENEAVRW